MLGIYHGHIVVQLKAARADWGVWVGFTCGSWSSEPFTCRVIHDTPQVNMVLVPGCISALCSPDRYIIRGRVWCVCEQCDHHQSYMISFIVCVIGRLLQSCCGTRDLRHEKIIVINSPVNA